MAGGIEFGRRFLSAHALFELAHAAAEGTAELGEPLGSEHHEDHDGDEQQVEGVLQAHLSTRIRLAGTYHLFRYTQVSQALITIRAGAGKDSGWRWRTGCHTLTIC